MSDSSNNSLRSDVKKRINTYFRSLDNHQPPTADLYNSIMKEIEMVLIEETLNFVSGNQVKAAKILGINRNTLRKKIKEFSN